MISEARDYIKGRVLDIDSSFKEHADAFNSDNIPKTLKNKSFFIKYDNTSNNVSASNWVDDNISVELDLFFKGYRSTQQALDDSMDLAHRIKLSACNICNWVEPIKHVSGDSVISEAVVSNDNQIIIRLQFTLKMVFSVI